MQDWELPLIIATLVFGAFTLWKVRPAFFSRSRRGARTALLAAHQRINEAKDQVTKANALCEAGELSLASGAGPHAASSFFLRAMRTLPHSPELVDRAARALEHKPHTLKHLLWRRLGGEPWVGEGRLAAIAALRHLRAIYAGPLRDPVRARAMDHALGALGADDDPSRGASA